MVKFQQEVKMCGLGRSFSEVDVQYPTWVYLIIDFFIALFTLENGESDYLLLWYMNNAWIILLRAMYGASQEESKLQLLHWKNDILSHVPVKQVLNFIDRLIPTCVIYLQKTMFVYVEQRRCNA